MVSAAAAANVASQNRTQEDIGTNGFWQSRAEMVYPERYTQSAAKLSTDHPVTL
jgi:hypothetical protein